jgi:hypothetical protein
MAELTITDLDGDIANTRAAITDVLKAAQSVNRPSLSYTRAALSDLREHLKYLLNMRRKMTGGLIVLTDQSGSTLSGIPETDFTNPNA